MADDSDAAPAVVREIISIEWDADKGPLVHPHVLPPFKAAAAAASAPGGPQRICEPVPLRHRAGAYSAPAPPLDHPEFHLPVSHSPAAAGSGGETARDDLEEDHVDSNARSFLWHVWRYAEMHGMTRQPVTSSQRPVLSGTVVARRRAKFDLEGAAAHESGHAVDGDRGSGQASVGSEADASVDAAEEFPVCTFILTTNDDHEKVPRHKPGSTPSGGGSRQSSGLAGTTLDMLLLVIPDTQPTSCRSWGSGTSANARCSAELAERCAGSLADGEEDERASSRPDVKEVVEQAKRLVERYLRLPMEHRRRDSAWWLFDNALALSKKRKCTPDPIPPPPHTPDTPQIPHTPLGARASSDPDCSLRAPSPAFFHPGIDGGGGGDASYPVQSLEGHCFSVRAVDLRHLLDLSVVTSLGVADSNLSGLLDPMHGVDWVGWFQHLVDSPLMCTLVFEDGDAVVAESKSPASVSRGATAPAAAWATGIDGGTREDADGASCHSMRRVLLALPAMAIPGGGDDAAGSRRGVAGDVAGGVATFDGEGEDGEGPWVGSSGGRASARPTSPEPRSMLFCVTLDKVGLCM